MRHKLKQLCTTYFFSMALLLTMGMCFANESSNYVIIPPRPVVMEDDFKIHPADFTKFSLFHLPVKNRFMIAPKSNEDGWLTSEQTTIHQEDNIKKPMIIDSAADKYEVAAYYLNVRTQATDVSDIIAVVSKGTILDVLNTTDNGWLALKNGGYVNGKYAKSMQSKQELMPETITTDVIDSESPPHEPTSMIQSKSGLTEAYIVKLFKGSSLAGHRLENAILDIEAEYGINAYFTIAVMKLESAHGESRIARDKNNLFGLNAIDGNEYNKALSFKTKGDSVRTFGQLIAENYIGEGYTTVEKVASKYCQANPEWAGLVQSIMRSDYNKL